MSFNQFYKVININLKYTPYWYLKNALFLVYLFYCKNQRLGNVCASQSLDLAAVEGGERAGLVYWHDANHVNVSFYEDYVIGYVLLALETVVVGVTLSEWPVGPSERTSAFSVEDCIRGLQCELLIGVCRNLEQA